MSGVKRFEELDVWQQARKLTTFVYGVTSAGKWGTDFGLRDQIRREKCVRICVSRSILGISAKRSTPTR